MALKQTLFSILLICFSFSTYSQKDIDKEFLKAYSSKDSSDYLFKKAYKRLKFKSDTASYLYFKFFKKDAMNENDSANYFAKKLIPLFHKLDTIKRLREVHERLYYQNLNNGNYENALKEIQTALELAKTIKDTALISLHYSDISILYHDFNFFDKGVAYGKKAYDIMSISKNIKYKYLIFANNAIGINFDDWNKPDSALFYHHKNLKHLKKVKDTLRFAFIYNNIANTNLKIKNYTNAKKFLKKSLAINLIRNRDYNLATNYTNLATIAFNESNNKEARKHFEQATFYAKKSNSIEKIRDVLEQEFLFYKKIKNYKKALQKQDSFYVLYDSVFKKERSSKFSKLEVEYQSIKKEKEIAQQKEELLKNELKIKNQNLHALLLASALIILGIISIGYYKKNQFKRKQLQKEIDLKEALTKIQTQNKLQEQRLRISRDLHDNIGSQLTFIISSVDNLKYVSKGANEKLKNKLSLISSFTSDTIFQLRDTIWAMNKSEITFDDLHARVLSFVEKAKTATNNINFIADNQIDTNFSFTSIVGINLFRVLQEAVNNSIKHAEATEVKIEMIEKNNRIHFNIYDNGKGFDIERTSIGNGLQNMEKRMSEIKGKVILKSTIGKGTIINITIQT